MFHEYFPRISHNVNIIVDISCDSGYFSDSTLMKEDPEIRLLNILILVTRFMEHHMLRHELHFNDYRSEIK